ncbi:hypothetical protein [Lacticaseibacillus rhamnosus]|uniref:hypothetical protein n=1 Tax=Lacticaseibacillus rhamnosus TaxID=47715 RepID=UPI0021A25DB0|nr:hypothetical protein [Lacticaseibacillus rhamnosus]
MIQKHPWQVITALFIGLFVTTTGFSLTHEPVLVALLWAASNFLAASWLSVTCSRH